jgi:ABC-2 type transport system ATP-binding protein
MEPVIEAYNLTKRFNSLTAVDSLSFTVERKEVFGFLGPNGAGKTTTIRMLTGLLAPDSGSILIDKVDIIKDPVRAKMKLGVIPEMGNIYGDLSAKDNIILAGSYYGYSSAVLIKKTDYLLNLFELADRQKQPVRAFSKGMKQRVNIASAIVHDPEILFLDEPTSGLDVKSQRLIKDIIKDINSKGTTVFLTTHNIEEANNLCGRVAIIDKGKIAAIDRPEVLRSTFEETLAVEVSFEGPVADDAFSGKGPIGRVVKSGDRFKLYTKDPGATVIYLADLSKTLGQKIISLEILKPSLEEAYIRFTEKKDGI